jgi:nickel superoxide dismutase
LSSNFHKYTLALLFARQIDKTLSFIKAYPVMIKTTFLASLLMAPLALSHHHEAQAHCQVPCGIFDDHARVHQMLEDASTAAKACRQLAALSQKKDAQSLNQSVRWINEKEAHAQKIITTISDYFLAQRVKVSQEDYTARLIKHHTVMTAAMKVKQNSDEKFVTALTDAIKGLSKFYPHHH